MVRQWRNRTVTLRPVVGPFWWGHGPEGDLMACLTDEAVVVWF